MRWLIGGLLGLLVLLQYRLWFAEGGLAEANRLQAQLEEAEAERKRIEAEEEAARRKQEEEEAERKRIEAEQEAERLR